MFLFFAIFDGIGTYSLPILMGKDGLSETEIGLIIGSSSIFGALFDYLYGKIFKNSHYRRLYMVMFSLSLFYPLILMNAGHLILYLLAMCIWGIYYDLSNYGNFNFISSQLPKDEHASGFGVLSVFKSLGFIIAPLIGGLVIGELIDWKPFVLMWIFLSFSFVAFLALTVLTLKKNNNFENHVSRKNYYNFKTMYNISTTLYPVLIFTILINIHDAFFWVIGPIVSEELQLSGNLNGLFLTLYGIPSLLVGWSVGNITQRFGKKRIAFMSLFLGSLVLITFSILPNSILILLAVLISSTFSSISWPSINGAYADYISETPFLEKDIESLQDFSTNIGYIIGPMLAGFFAESFGNMQSFTILGIIGGTITLLLLIITPKSIKVHL